MIADSPSMPDRQRLKPIPNVHEWYPDLGFSGRSALSVSKEPIAVTDPIYIADIYNPNDDPIVSYVRDVAVIVNDFGGDVACPAWWRDPFLVLPTSTHLESIDAPPHGWVELSGHVGCDSASFMFMVMQPGMPGQVLKRMNAVLKKGNGALLHLPPGLYTFWLEQFEGYAQPHVAGMYRNIVAERVR